MFRTILLFIFALMISRNVAFSAEVEIVAHRGASHDAPENSVSAIKLAWEQGADGSEFDVYLSSDKQIVVMHDKNTKRTAGIDLLISKTAAADLQKLDIGTWKSPKFKDERIPALADMLATVPKGKQAFIEVKCGPEIVPELEKALKAAKLKPEHTPVIAFNAKVIEAFKKARPDVPAYWLVGLHKEGDKLPPTAESLIKKAKEIKADGLDLSANETLDAVYAKKILDAGLKLYVYTVDKPELAKRMVKVGVHGITTNRPAWLREQLKK
jgi:glycerophosphoryl diester phosphodiesterase